MAALMTVVVIVGAHLLGASAAINRHVDIVVIASNAVTYVIVLYVPILLLIELRLYSQHRLKS